MRVGEGEGGVGWKHQMEGSQQSGSTANCRLVSSRLQFSETSKLHVIEYMFSLSGARSKLVENGHKKSQYKCRFSLIGSIFSVTTLIDRISHRE